MRAKDGDLRVWWIPQVPMKPFLVDVASPEDGKWLLGVLASYDKFQFNNKIKPDYCNAGGLYVFEDGEWCEWCDEFGNQINEVRP